ncbi:MAG: polysaccharide deacetylase family protein [Candidatus Omnitrophica bacterium]|nr:polysaccharide deacetylase family protein [Candidatus Omnitrophota bacterium]
MRIVALTFHDIVPNGNDAAIKSDEFYRITTSEFEKLLSQLRKLGYQTVSSRTFRAWQQGSGTLPERTVVLTFDDGHANHFELVAPLLVRYRFTGTFFVTSGFIGTPGYMNWEQLRKLVFLGMEIGSHGATHRPLTQLARAAVVDELASSKTLLEQRLGIPVQAMAAPGGFWNHTIADASKEAGYEAVWVSTIGTNGKETSPLALRRVVVRQPFSVERIVAMVEGWQPAFWWAANQQLLIRLLKRVLGVYWYEQLKRRLVPNA